MCLKLVYSFWRRRTGGLQEPLYTSEAKVANLVAERNKLTTTKPEYSHQRLLTLSVLTSTELQTVHRSASSTELQMISCLLVPPVRLSWTLYINTVGGHRQTKYGCILRRIIIECKL